MSKDNEIQLGDIYRQDDDTHYMVEELKVHDDNEFPDIRIHFIEGDSGMWLSLKDLSRYIDKGEDILVSRVQTNE